MKILFLFLICFSSTAFAQSLRIDSTLEAPKPNQPYLMIDTIVQTNYTKAQLYSNTISYLANSFKDSRVVIENKDLDLGEVIFHGILGKKTPETIIDKKGKSSVKTTQSNLIFKCKIYLKDKKFKIVLSSLEYPISGYALGVNLPLGFPSDKEESYIKGARELTFSLIKDLSNNINSKPINDF